MSPEERFTRIENAIEALMEIQARHQTQIEMHTAQLEKQSAQLEKQSAQIEQQGAGIRDLIVLSRTFLDSLTKSDAQMEELREALKTLTRNVDKLARGRGSNGDRK